MIDYVGVLWYRARCRWWHRSGDRLLSVNNDDLAVNQIMDRIPKCITAVSQVSRDTMETAIEVRVVPMQKRTRRWVNLGKP